MLIQDCLILSIAKPTKLSDGRISRCIIGYSDEMKELVRLYPTYYKSKKIAVGNVIKVEVIRGDSRENSFKLKHSKNLKRADRKIKVVDKMIGMELINIVRQLPKTTITELNEKKKSIGIIEPHDTELEIKNGKPYLKYIDTKVHKQQVLDENFSPLTYSKPDFLIVGNHHAHRSAFMVISGIRSE